MKYKTYSCGKQCIIRINYYFCGQNNKNNFQFMHHLQQFYTIGLLIVSNIFMTFAWYGHLKLQQIKVFSDNTPLYVIILLSWLLALPEYSCQVPANRIGFDGNGGPFNIMQLKVIQEVISLAVFTVFVTVFFNGESLRWNHLAAFVCLVMAVFFVFHKW